MIKTKIIKKHNKDCWMVNGENGSVNPWSMVVKRDDYRDSIGRKNNGGYCRWVIISCNDPKCNGELGININAIVDEHCKEMTRGK